MKKTNQIYYIWSEYVLNKYCFILYIILSLFILKLDSYTGILLIILALGSFRTASKEYFASSDQVTDSIPTKIVNGQILADIPIPSVTSLQVTVNANDLLKVQTLGEDSRFKMDDVVVKDILRQIKSQVDFDPYKTNLDKSVIYEIYNKYFDNDIFVKLKNNNDDSASYLAAGNFSYIPTVAQVDYDLVTYQNLNDNVQFGINPIIDGITNKTITRRGS
jgi:ABC-type antimicrobial peptide transport system permease subunit